MKGLTTYQYQIKMHPSEWLIIIIYQQHIGKLAVVEIQCDMNLNSIRIDIYCEKL